MAPDPLHGCRIAHAGGLRTTQAPPIRRTVAPRPCVSEGMGVGTLLRAPDDATRMPYHSPQAASSTA